MNKSTLIIFGIIHNSRVLFNRFQMAFYEAFDNIEMYWWLFKNKTKNKGDYHLRKLGDVMEENGDDDIMMYFAALTYMKFMGWDVKSEMGKNILFGFYPHSYNHFFFDFFRLECAVRCINAKNMGDVIDMMNFIGAVSIPTLIDKIGKNNYSLLRVSSFYIAEDTLKLMQEEKN